jgi:hypothetical protein
MQECSICLEIMTENRILPCCHKFHSNCINIWLKENNNCPLCRQDVSPPLKKIKIKDEYNNNNYLNNFSHISALHFLDPSESSSDSDDEKSIDYGDESDFEEELTSWEDDTPVSPRSFQISSTLSINII